MNLEIVFKGKLSNAAVNLYFPPFKSNIAWAFLPVPSISYSKNTLFAFAFLNGSRRVFSLSAFSIVSICAGVGAFLALASSGIEFNSASCKNLDLCSKLTDKSILASGTFAAALNTASLLVLIALESADIWAEASCFWVFK